MRIRIRYENKQTYLEVPDEDFNVMIDADYEDRLSKAGEEEIVTRRSPQEIMDECFNKPDYNNWHKFDRHRGMPKKAFRKDDQAIDETDHMDSFPDCSHLEAWEEKEEYEYICRIIRQTLKPQHVEPLIAIKLDGMLATEYAELEGVSKSAISHRLKTAEKKFRKVFPESSTFPFSQGY